MGAWAGQPNIGGMQPQQQGGDVPPFDLPQAPQGLRQGGQGPMPNLQGGQGPMPGGNMQDRWPVVNPPSERMLDPNYYLPHVYQQELGRDPDQAGMDYWRQQFDNGMSMDQIRQMFDQSQEGQAYNQQPPRFSNDPRYPHMHPQIADALRLANPNPGGQLSPSPSPFPPGTTPDVAPPQFTNDDYLRTFYRKELGRDPDQGGMDYWRQQMQGGMSPDQMRKMLDQSEEGQAYNQRPMPEPRNQLMGMSPGLAGLLGGMFSQPRSSTPTQEQLDYAQRLGADPFSPEVQDALRIAKGLPVY